MYIKRVKNNFITGNSFNSSNGYNSSNSTNSVNISEYNINSNDVYYGVGPIIIYWPPSNSK